MFRLLALLYGAVAYTAFLCTFVYAIGFVAGVGVPRHIDRGPDAPLATARQVDVLAAFVAAGGSVADAAARVGVRPSTAKRHLADLRARSGLTTEQLIYRGRAEGWLVVASLEPS